MIASREKLLIGAIGAVCLGLLKLIGANFYLAEASAEVAVGAYLTYGAFLVLGMVVAYFFAEDGPDAARARRSAFILGLLAPSVLIAIASRPQQEPPLQTALSGDVPTLGGSVTGGESGHVANALIERRPSIVDIARATAPQGVADGMRAALGRAAAPLSYLLVLGKTRDKAFAVTEAARIDRVLSANDATRDLSTVVLTSQDTAEIYISVGFALTAEQAVKMKRLSAESAIATLQEGVSTEDAIAAAKLLRGQIVRGADLRR